MRLARGKKIILTYGRLDELLGKYLWVFLAIIFLKTVELSYSGYISHNNWRVGDWLINYQGGMVRRGLLGEIIYNISEITNVNPGFFVFLLQSMMYAFFFIFSYALLKRQYSLLPYILIIFSPFIFTFQINDPQGGFRKEIIYLALLSFVVYSSKIYKYKDFEKIFFVVILFYPVLILSHEMLAIFLPYILVVYFSNTRITKLKLFTVIILLIPSVVSLFFSLYYTGSEANVTGIYNSLATQGYNIEGGAVSWLDKPASYGISKVTDWVISAHYIEKYLLVILVSMVAFVPLSNNLKFILRNNALIALIFTSFIGTVAVFSLAIDWGRFIYIHLVSLFLLSLMQERESGVIANDLVSNLSSYSYFNGSGINYFMAIFVASYFLFWHVPHCCW